MLNRFHRILLVSLVPASLALAACGGSVAEQPTATADSAVTKAPVAQNAQGPVKMIGLALGEVPLRAAQRTEIEKLAADADARHATTKQARQALAEAVAQQVEAGKIDRAALQPKIDAVATAMEQVRPADRAAFERLHAILDADQRAAFVNALEAQVHAKMGEHPGKHHMHQWATDLKLTDDQKSQIHAIMKDRFAAMKSEHERHAKDGHDGAHGKKMLEAFKQDRFVMDEVAPAVDVHAAAKKMSDRMLGFVEAVVPVLTPEQRTIAAQKIRTQATTEAAHVTF